MSDKAQFWIEWEEDADYTDGGSWWVSLAEGHWCRTSELWYPEPPWRPLERECSKADMLRLARKALQGLRKCMRENGQ